MFSNCSQCQYVMLSDTKMLLNFSADLLMTVESLISQARIDVVLARDSYEVLQICR
jgi:hypothetical protein